MKEEFIEAATALTNRYVKESRKSGKKIIGYPCTFTPEEIIHAGGMFPFRLRGLGAESTTFSDIYFGPVICSFPKCILELAGGGKYEFLDGVVVSDGCDASRRMDECWRKAGEDHDGVAPSFFHYFSTPHKVSDYSISWFVKEIERLKESIEQHFDLQITNEDLAASIKIYNKRRLLLQKLDTLRTGAVAPISGADAQAIILASTAMPPEIFNSLLEEMLDDLGNGQARKQKDYHGKRLMLAGSVIDDVDLVKLIEDSGALVVSDNQCFGSRTFVDMDEEQTEPVLALAKRYLSKTACPRMFGYYRDRFRYLKDQVETARVDGVILQNIRFCDLHGADNGLFKRDLEKAGIPCLLLEREYGPLTDDGRISMRLDAFIESIS